MMKIREIEFEPGQSVAEAVLMDLLDAKGYSSESKMATRNILIPMLEYVDTAPSMEETITRMKLVMGMLVSVLTYGVQKVAPPSKYEIVSSFLDVDFSVQLETGIKKLIEKAKEKEASK